MRILGIDPGYAIVGFGIVSYHGADFTPLEYGAITTEAGTRFAARLTAIYDDLDYLLKRFQPDCIAIERLYFTSNQKDGDRRGTGSWRHRPLRRTAPDPDV